MAFDMSTVTSLYVKDNNVKLYKQVFTITNDEALHDINGDPISLLYTVYSTTQVQWTGTTTNSADFYNFLTSCGYKAVNNKVRIGFDNQKYVYYTYNGVDYPIQSSDCGSAVNVYFSIYIYTTGNTYPKVPECSITGSGWTEVTFPEELPFVVKQYEYQRTTSKIMTFLAIGNDLNGDYIKQYFIGTTAYPDVTIVSVSGNRYTLSDGNSYNISRPEEVNTLTQHKEVIKIQDSNNVVIWEKPRTWHTIWSGSRKSIAEAYYGSWKQYTAGGVITTINTNNYGTASDVQVRVTFSMNASGNGGASFTPSNKKSPVTFTGIGSAHRKFLNAEGTASNAAYYAAAYCSYTVNGSTGTFQLYVGRNGTSTASNQGYYAEVTVTKIELYY